MDGSHIRRFFLEPRPTFQRQYEALCAIFVEDEPLERVAERFGYKPSTLRSMASRLRADCRRGITTPFFSGRPWAASRGRRGRGRSGPETPDVTDCRELKLEPGRTIRSRVAGVFLFLPLLARLGFDRLVERGGLSRLGDDPGPGALLSPLALKLLDKERRSHLSDFNADAVLGLFAGLNVLPKKSFATAYSYRASATINGACCGVGQGPGPGALPRGRWFLAGLPPDPVPRRPCGAGPPLSSAAGRSRAERADVLRTGAGESGLVLLPTPT